MAQQSATVSDNRAGAPGKAPMPPDEQFWVRYSPHHEFPLSSITSIVVHFLLLILVFVTIWIAWKLGWTEDTHSVPVDVVVVEEVGGGGGKVGGVGGGSGDGGDPPPPEEATEPKERDPKAPVVNLPDFTGDPLELPKLTTDKGERVVPQGGEAIQSLAKLDKEVRSKLFIAAGQGKGGSGSGGGNDTGKDTGTGSGGGAGTGKISRTQQRMLRWTMIFNTEDGRDYARQLSSLGAIVAFQDPEDPNEYRVIRDLKASPAPSQREDITQIKRIFWVDDKPGSVRSLAGALGVGKPEFFAMFFPSSLEQTLLKKELSYRGRTEDQIDSTRFKVVRSGDGYEVQVEAQTAK
jgi:hypothetical protein